MVNFFVSMGALEDLGNLHDDADEALVLVGSSDLQGQILWSLEAIWGICKVIHSGDREHFCLYRWYGQNWLLFKLVM